MSMSTYTLNETGALFITGEIAAYFMLYFDRKSNMVPEEVQQALNEGRFTQLARSESGLPDEYYSPADVWDCLNGLEIECWYHSEVDGGAVTLTTEGEEYPYARTWTFDCESILYIPAKRVPSLFHAAYANIQELEGEFHETLKDILPPDVNIRPFIVELNGSYVS